MEDAQNKEPQNEGVKTLCFALSNEVRYTNAEGGFSATKELVLYSPCNADQPIARHLRQMLMNSMVNVSIKLNPPNSGDKGQDNRTGEELKEAKEKADNYIPAKKEVISFIYSQTTILLDSFFHKFKQLMCTPCCKLDDRMPLKASVYDSFSYEDKDRLAGEYCAFFLPPSF